MSELQAVEVGTEHEDGIEKASCDQEAECGTAEKAATPTH
jgi:hypothetical protein